MDPSPNERWHQLWGTFSVRDHCRKGAFVAEVLLYDHLLIPVPPTPADGLTPEQAEAEWNRWETQHHWQPRRQREILEILGDRARQIPWTAELQEQWESAMQQEFSAARRNGYFMTGSVLQQFSPAMARSVVAVSRYHRLEDLPKAGIRQLHPAEKLPANTLLAVMGHELLLPDDPERDDPEVLREAVKVAADPAYRQRRQDLYEWQQQFLASGETTDVESVRAAVAHMQKLVDELRTATARQKKWKWAKRFFSFLGVASKGAPLGGPAFAIPGASAGVIAAIGSFAVDEATARQRPAEPGVPAATLILDAQQKLGIE
jgi:hypothetical protein